MKPRAELDVPAAMVLAATTAKDLMTTNPLSIHESATVREAIGFLIDKGFSAAPVIDQAGRPIGVISRADILVHDRERVEHLATVPEYYQKTELTTQIGKGADKAFQVESVDQTRVRDIMTPVVFSVTPATPARRVVQDMVDLKVHRLFVVDEAGVLVGVISVLDVLRNMR